MGALYLNVVALLLQVDQAGRRRKKAEAGQVKQHEARLLRLGNFGGFLAHVVHVAEHGP